MFKSFFPPFPFIYLLLLISEQTGSILSSFFSEIAATFLILPVFVMTDTKSNQSFLRGVSERSPPLIRACFDGKNKSDSKNGPSLYFGGRLVGVR